MDNAIIIQFLGASAVAAVMGGIVQGIINRRKLGAEATSIITNAAGGLVQNLQTDNGRLRAENASASLREERFRTAVRRRDSQIRLQHERHYNWDKLMVQALREAGITIADPPKLELPDLDYDEDDDTLSIESPGPGK